MNSQQQSKDVVGFASGLCSEIATQIQNFSDADIVSMQKKKSFLLRMFFSNLIIASLSEQN